MALMATITYVKGKITYQPLPSQPVLEVHLDGKHVGTIFRRNDREAYFYRPLNGIYPSRDYPTLDAIKASLEGRDG